ncbi:MAG: glycosyltransferase family 4 protein [Patescibacteria group bacterium]
MKKILLATLEFPPMRGGVAEYLYGLFSALPHDRVAVLTDAAKGETPPAMYPIRHARLLGPRRLPWRWLAALGPVVSAVREERAEALAVSHLLPMGYVALMLKRLWKLPYVVFTHGTDLHFAARSPWKRLCARHVLRNADLVVANSEYTRALAVAAGAPRERTEVVFPCPGLGHSAMDDKAEAKRELGFDRRLVVLSVGRLARRKGFDRMIRALFRLRKSCGDVVYLLVGSGPEREALEREAARHALKPYVMFHASVPREKLHYYFGAADAFVLPAREVAGDVEGFGIVLVEAQAHGLPIVTTRVGGIPEAVVGGATATVLSEDAGDDLLADEVCRMLTDRTRAAAYGEAGRRRANSEFNWPKQAAKLRARLETL